MFKQILLVVLILPGIIFPLLLAKSEAEFTCLIFFLFVASLFYLMILRKEVGFSFYLNLIAIIALSSVKAHSRETSALLFGMRTIYILSFFIRLFLKGQKCEKEILKIRERFRKQVDEYLNSIS